MFGNSTSSRSASAMVRSTPPGVGPGRYEQPSFKVEARSGESVAGFSAFLGPERACNKKTVTSALGPGSHRPELYTAMVRPQSQPPPRIATAKAVRRPMLAAREEIRQRGTTPSIRAQTATGFIYEETPDGQLRPIDGAPNTRQPPPELPSPFSYSPLDTRIALAARHVDFSRSAGRTSKLSGTGGPPELKEGAPDWHDGTNANPLPNRDLPSAAFGAPPPSRYPHVDHLQRQTVSASLPHGSPTGETGGTAGPCLAGGTTDPNLAGGTADPNLATSASRVSTPGGVPMAMATSTPTSEDWGTEGGGGAAMGAEAPSVSVNAKGAEVSLFHTNRHSRGRTNIRGRLVATTGVQDGHGGLLARQLAMRNASVEMPGPAHEYAVPPGVGRTRPLPRTGLPRTKPFRSAHLRALGSLPPRAATSLPSGGSLVSLVSLVDSFGQSTGMGIEADEEEALAALATRPLTPSTPAAALGARGLPVTPHPSCEQLGGQHTQSAPHASSAGSG